MKKRLLSILLALCMLLSVMPMMSITASAAEAVSYRYPVYNTADVPTSGIKEWKTGLRESAVISSSTSWGSRGKESWYFVNRNVTIRGRVTVQGDVRIILMDGVTLTCSSGITVSGSENSLTIYGQTEGTGELIASAGNSYPGIGSAENGYPSKYITINGGKVTATGGNDAAGIGGGKGIDASNITINGGTITATGGGGGAGIGCGRGTATEHKLASDITINGGTVTATGKTNSAGIGGGFQGSAKNITITGGNVTANSDGTGAGIGGGSFGSGSNIIITGGTVTATGRTRSAGIGGGSDKGSGSNIIITGGTVDATGGSGYSGIGGGEDGKGENIKIATSLIVKAGASKDKTSVVASDRTDDTDIASSLVKMRIVTTTPKPTHTIACATCTNGSVSADKETATSGTTVTITPTADSGYLVDKVYYTPEGESQTEITLADSKYTFTMPDKAVTVSATFKLNKVDVTGVSLNKSATTLKVGDTETLTATVAPDGATDKSVTWSSSAESVATVDQNGKITAVAKGTATITVTATDGSKTDTCTVKVMQVYSENIAITYKTPLAIGDTVLNIESKLQGYDTDKIIPHAYIIDTDTYDIVTSIDKVGVNYWVSFVFELKDSYEYFGYKDTIVNSDHYNLYTAQFSATNETVDSIAVIGDYIGNSYTQDNPTKFNALGYDTFVMFLPEAVKDAEYYASLTLNENIDVNFSMENLGTGFDIDKLTVTVDGADPEKAMTLDKNGNVVGVLKSVSPNEIGKSLHVVVTYDGVKIKEFDYSIIKYCNAVYNASGYGAESTLGKLCTALLNYGKWAEDYYNEVNKISAAESTVNSGHEIDFSVSNFFGSYTPPATEFTGSTTVTHADAYLGLGSKITLNFDVYTTAALTKDNIRILNNDRQKVDPDNITITAINSATYGNGYNIKIASIGASKLSRTYTLTINGVPESTFKIVYGVESYCYNVQNLTGDAYTATLKTLCKAIYNYAEAAKAYATK